MGLGKINALGNLMDEKELRRLLQQYLEGTCSHEERLFIESWYNQLGKDMPPALTDEEIEEDLQAVWAALPQPPIHKRTVPLWSRIAAAAAVVIALSVGAYLYFSRTSEVLPMATVADKPSKTDIEPGENKAVLTLADGSRIDLDNKASGQIAEQGGIKITKAGNGLLIYSAILSSTADRHNSEWNSISTPKGGQYQVILPDGTKVWLNAASSLRYPTAFIGNERKVELKGEGYFEVAKNTKQPFKVQTAGQLVEVLGTHFNINSYGDEPAVQTTLLEGSVKISVPQSGRSRVLIPGEQATLVNNQFKVAEVNTENIVAWKNGLFHFSGSDIHSVMRQLSRWYGVDVEFEGKVPDMKLWGKVYRNENASRALELLSYFNLKYRIEEKGGKKKIIILQ